MVGGRVSPGATPADGWTDRPVRRRVVGRATAAGVLLVTGCSGDGPPPTPGEVTPTRPPDAADDDLVERVRARLARARDEVTALGEGAGEDAPDVADRASDLGRLHRAHLRELGAPPPVRSVPGRRRAANAGEDAQARLTSVEVTLQADLADAAVDARSGALAQLFASMSAAIAQRVTA